MRAPEHHSCGAIGSHGIHPCPSCSRGAFSLIELLVVVGLILIVIALMWGPSSSSYQKRQAQLCEENLQKIQVAMEIYAHDNAGKFPVTPGARSSEDALAVLVPKYTADTSIFTCPASKDSPLSADEAMAKGKISYAYYMGRRLTENNEVLMSDRQVDERSKAAGQPIFSSTGKSPGNNHRKSGGNLLYCDGHVVACPADVPFPVVLTSGVVLLNPKLSSK